MNARTPGTRHRTGRPVETVLAIAAANDGPLNTSTLSLVQDARTEYLDLRDSHDALTAQRDALAEALRETVRILTTPDRGRKVVYYDASCHICFQLVRTTTDKPVLCTDCALDEARAALAKVRG